MSTNSQFKSANRSILGYANQYADRADDYYNTASGLMSYGANNLLKYGDVSEEDLVNQAVSDNTMSYDKAMDTTLRNMSRMGINPNSGRYQGMQQSYNLARAAAEAGARNKARIQARYENANNAGRLLNAGSSFNSMGNSAISSAANFTNAYMNNLNNYGTKASGYAEKIDKLSLNNKLSDLRNATNSGIRGYNMNTFINTKKGL